MDLLTRPFRVGLTIPFRGVDERAGVLLRGPRGWGEFSPFPDYAPEAAARWLAAAYEAATTRWPEPVRARIPVNVTVPAVSPEDAHEIASSSGCTTAKVKVGEGDDAARVEAVRDALGPSGHIRVDANGAWDVDAATRAIADLSRYDLEYVEQPVTTLEEMAALRRRVDVPLAADESVRALGDPLHIKGLHIKGLDAADVVVLKTQPMGGVWPALRVAEAAGLPAVVSSALETSVGLAAGIALAAALPELEYACGLGTGLLLADDVVVDPLVPVDGMLEVRRPEVDEVALARCTPDADAARALLARMEAAQEVLV